jgi:polyisoprenoid-binding protein YceI
MDTVRPRIPLLAFALLVAAVPARAERVEYAIDPVHTRVAFIAGHAGFSKAIGTFAGPGGTLVFDDADWKSSRVDVTIPLASLDLGDAAWRKAVLGNMFLDADKLPQAHFVSTAVEDLGGGKLKITGDLTLHGVTKPVVLDATFNAHKKHPLTFRRTAGFSATATLSRKDFDLGAWPGVIADRVDVLIEVEASRPKASASTSAASGATPAEAAQPVPATDVPESMDPDDAPDQQ